MNYEEWLAAVPSEFISDPLWHMEVYRPAMFASDLAWQDVSRLMEDKRTVSLSDQLYRAVGSISANISEGYSRSSGRDQARFYEYALGSAREARGWYCQGRHVLSEPVAKHRIKLLTAVARMLLKIIPSERGYKIREEVATYRVRDDLAQDTELSTLLAEISMP